MAAVSEDEVIRRKLLIDGDGGMDDKRITNLQKQIVEWCSSKSEGTDIEKNSRLQKLLSTLSQIEYQALKTQMVTAKQEQEQDRYQRLYAEIGEQIEKAVVEIENCKEELKKAKQIRRNKQEYDAWAKKVMEHPDRQTTQKELKSEQTKLEELNQTQKDLEDKLELRKKQFAVLVTSIQDLQDTLENETVTDADMETS